MASCLLALSKISQIVQLMWFEEIFGQKPLFKVNVTTI
jgi:hypothetical protein